MNSKNKEALWKQILDRLTVTKDDRALFAGESVLPLTVTTAQPLAPEETELLTALLSEKFGKPVLGSPAFGAAALKAALIAKGSMKA